MPKQCSGPDQRTAAPSCCVICGCGRLVLIHDQTQSRFFPRRIWRCTDCGFAFVFPPPGSAELRAVYADTQYFDRRGAATTSELLDNPRVSRRAQSRLRWLRRHVAPAELLDVGCHRGEFLHFARQQGWRVTGFDVSSVAAAGARALTGAEIFESSLAELARSGRRFALVTAWDVIEHVPDPHGFVSDCRALLADDGHLALSTPNQANYHALVHGDAWKGYSDGPEHLLFFKAATLCRLLADCGFTIVSRRTRRIAPVALRWMQYLGYGNELEVLARAVPNIA